MVFDKPSEAFVKDRPMCVMVVGTLERVCNPAVLDQVFRKYAVRGYIWQLLLSPCVQTISAVVFREVGSVGAY